MVGLPDTSDIDPFALFSIPSPTPQKSHKGGTKPLHLLPYVNSGLAVLELCFQAGVFP